MNFINWINFWSCIVHFIISHLFIWFNHLVCIFLRKKFKYIPYHTCSISSLLIKSWGKKLIYIPDLDQICLMIICLKWKFVFLGTWRLCWITTSGLYTTHGNSCPRSVKSLISQIIDMKTLSQYPKTYVRNSGILNRFCCQYSWSIWCYRASLVCPGETHQ